MAEQKLQRSARSLKIAAHGVRTADDFAVFMASLMSDLIEGKITPQVGNAACNAAGKLIRVVEMKFKYGVDSQTGNRRELDFVAVASDAKL